MHQNPKCSQTFSKDKLPNQLWGKWSFIFAYPTDHCIYNEISSGTSAYPAYILCKHEGQRFHSTCLCLVASRGELKSAETVELSCVFSAEFNLPRLQSYCKFRPGKEITWKVQGTWEIWLISRGAASLLQLPLQPQWIKRRFLSRKEWFYPHTKMLTLIHSNNIFATILIWRMCIDALCLNQSLIQLTIMLHWYYHQGKRVAAW